MTRKATKISRSKRTLEATPWTELKVASNDDSHSKETQNEWKPSKGKKPVDKKIEAVKEMKRLRKSESRRLKRIFFRSSDKTCFNCRKKGHTLSACPETNKDIQGTGICFKCGSTNHISKFCKVKLKEAGGYPYATCFICNNTGHIAKDCPDNSHGLYPNGGCCLECGSVRHLRKDCPEKQKKQGIMNMTLPTLKMTESADAEVALEVADQKAQTKPALSKRKTRKVVLS